MPDWQHSICTRMCFGCSTIPYMLSMSYLESEKCLKNSFTNVHFYMFIWFPFFHLAFFPKYFQILLEFGQFPRFFHEIGSKSANKLAFCGGNFRTCRFSAQKACQVREKCVFFPSWIFQVWHCPAISKLQGVKNPIVTFS